MGYETILEFVGVTINKKHLRRFLSYVDKHKHDKSSDFHWMLNYLCLETNEHGCLSWNVNKLTRRDIDSYCETPLVSIKSIDFTKVKYVFVKFFPNVYGSTGMWYDSEALVHWLAPYCTGGEVTQINEADDGALWGWKFNKNGRICELGLIPWSGWRKSRIIRKRIK